MTIRTLVLHPDPRLKKVCTPVKMVDDNIRTLMDDMLETMYDAPGIGLAACQIGVLKRVLVMDCDEGVDPDINTDTDAGNKTVPDTKSDAEDLIKIQPVCMANPEITWSSEALNDYDEGCLSIPEANGTVTRPERVRVKFLDYDNNEQEQEFDGLWATCVQHEIDHLNGKLFIDYLSLVKRNMITRKMVKLKRMNA